MLQLAGLVSGLSQPFVAARLRGTTKVTETWTDQRNRILYFIGPYITGVRDRAPHNRETMKVTLQRLKDALEKEHQSA